MLWTSELLKITFLRDAKGLRTCTQAGPYIMSQPKQCHCNSSSVKQTMPQKTLVTCFHLLRLWQKQPQGVPILPAFFVTPKWHDYQREKKKDGKFAILEEKVPCLNDIYIDGNCYLTAVRVKPSAPISVTLKIIFFLYWTSWGGSA